MEQTLTAIRAAVKEGRILWKRHALERMLERGISRTMVKRAILDGQVIETYPDDYPTPSLLICYLEPEPLHVVLAWDADGEDCHLVTAYRPDLEHFEPGFVRRRPR
ncbi:MAG: DUF4258 domain-containing protein [Pseudomonadota bacterium]|nr:DUF4258 domain-containing protein [Pseudomonadota bacterium]